MEWYLMVWKRYAEFSGRSRRKELWMFALFNTIICTVLYVGGMMMAMRGSSLGTIFFALYGIYALAVLVPSLAVEVRRLHDIGKSGWWLLIAFVPIVGRNSFARLVCERQPAGRQPVWPQSEIARTRSHHRLTKLVVFLEHPPAPAHCAAGAARLIVCRRAAAGLLPDFRHVPFPAPAQSPPFSAPASSPTASPASSRSR